MPEPKEVESEGFLGSERQMDIMILEAQSYADELYAEWLDEFLGVRKTAPTKVKANAPTQLQQPGGSVSNQSPY